jgi:hypothetical protein
MKHDPRFQENDVIDYDMKEALSKLSDEELDRLYEDEKKKIKKFAEE